MSTDAAVERAGRVPPTRPEGFGPPDLLRTIVTRPRATMRWVLDHGDGGLWMYLLFAALVTFAIPGHPGASPVVLKLPPDSWTERSLSFGLTLGVVGFALAGFWLVATMIARLLGGVGRWRQTLQAVAWGLVPFVATLPVAIAERVVDPTRAPMLASVLDGVGIVAFVGSCVLAVFTLAETHRFTWWRSAISLLVATALLGLVAMIGFAAVFGTAMDD